VEWIADVLFAAGLVLVALGWVGARFSPALAKHRRRLVVAGVCLWLVFFGTRFVQGAIEGYRDGIARAEATRQKTGPAR
jgi:hypothetical protein